MSKMNKKKTGKQKAVSEKEKFRSIPEKEKVTPEKEKTENVLPEIEKEFDEAHNVEEVKPVRISLHMIARSHLPEDSTNWEQEQILAGLDQITHLRLDRQNISHIDSLELLGRNVTNVYLQVNRIEKIENLESLVNLRFMTLADNKITRIEGLSHLNSLGFLDLSNNDIKEVDIDELPQSLVILNLKDNPCAEHPDHRGRMIQDLPKLRQLDLEEVSRQERIEAGYTVSSSEEDEEEDEEEEDEKGGGDQCPVDLPGILQRIRRRVQDRIEESDVEHMERMTVLAELKGKYTPR